MSPTLYRMPNRKNAAVFRLPAWAAVLALYASFCLMGVFEMRSVLMGVSMSPAGALLTRLFPAAGMSVRISDWVYMFSGVLDMLWFEILVRIVSGGVRLRFPHVDAADMRHVLRCFYVLRNLLLAALYLVMFRHPVSIGMVLNFMTFMVTTLTLAGFYWYFAAHHLPRFLAGQGLVLMGRYYIGYHLLVVLLYLVMGVAL